MFVDVPLKGIRVSRRKYFDILLPRLKRNNFNQENSFSYYYYRVFLRQENTIYLVLRLMLIAGIIISSFNNIYVSVATIISYNYLAIIQLVPLYKQITNNMWHNILPVSEKVKVTKSDETTEELQLPAQAVDVKLKGAELTEDNKLKLTLSDDSVIEADLAKFVDAPKSAADYWTEIKALPDFKDTVVELLKSPEAKAALLETLKGEEVQNLAGDTKGYLLAK